MKDIRLESYIDGEPSIEVRGYYDPSKPLTSKTEVQWYSQSGNISNMPSELGKISLSQKIKDIMMADSQNYNGTDYQIKRIEGLEK